MNVAAKAAHDPNRTSPDARLNEEKRYFGQPCFLNGPPLILGLSEKYAQEFLPSRIHPASYYASLFDAAKISIEPAVVRAHGRWPELGVATIGQGDLEFEIFIPTKEGCVPERLLSTARSVLSHVVEMDDAARADPCPINDDEVLAYVWIHDAYVELHYYSTKVNTEWSVYFTSSDEGGWDYRGLQPP